jgi:integrase
VVIYKLIGKNPIEGVKPPKMKKPKHDIFNEDSLAELLIRVRGHEFEIPINMAAALGMRRGEILGLHWNNVDFDIGKIYVREELIWTKETRIDYKEPKSDESIRDIDIPASLISLLKKHHIKQEKDKLFFGTEYKDNNLVVCQDNGEPYLPYSFTKRFKTLIVRLDIGKTTFHGLRHAYATLQLKYGTSMKEVSGLLGHSTIQFSQDSYQHVLDDMKRKAAKKINDKLYKKVNKVVAIK